MAALRDFQSILDKLQSDKMKERTEGVARCRDFLASKRSFAALDQDRNHSWLETLQTLFHVVITERNAHANKKTAPNEKRLDDAALLVRYCAEKVHPLLGRKQAKALVNHLTQMIAIQGTLQPYALTYLKTLRSVLSFPPHLEHLDERQWTDIVMLCFSAVLGDKIRIGQDFADDVAMDIDSDSDDERPRARGALRADSDDERAHLLAATGSTSSARKARTQKRTATPVEIELLHVVEVLFRSQSAPFLLYAQSIFRKFLRFFRLFPDETSAHYPALVALNRAFAELDLNDQRSMRRLGPRLWTPVLALWGTKNAGTKEQVLVALRYLFPFVVPPPQLGGGGGGGGEEEATRRAKELYAAVLTEPTIRWREAYALDLDCLRLGLPSLSPSSSSSAGAEKAFHAQTFRLAAGFDDKHAVAWATVELGARALARVYEVGESLGGEEEREGVMSPTQRVKRRRIEDPLSLLLDSLSDPTLPTTAITFRLQILLFLVDRHWSSLSPEACRRILDGLVPLLPNPSEQVERWTFLCLAAIAHAGLPDLPPALDAFSASRRAVSPATASSPWDQVWLLALRRLTLPELARAAAHTANVLLAHGRVSAVRLTDSLESFAKDLDVQGLNFPSDAVCLFLEWVLAVAAADARLFRLKLADKVLAWATSSTAWKPLDGIARAHSFGQARPSADPLSVGGLFRLLARLAGVPAAEVPNLPYDELVPDCPVATMAVELAETRRVRDYVEARVPEYVRDDSTVEAPWRTPGFYDGGGAGGGGGGGAAEDLEHAAPRKISAFFLRTLERFKADATDGAGDAHWSGMAADLARRHLDFSALALAVEGLFALHKLPSNKATVRSAGDVLTALAPTLALKKWHPAERAFLLAGLAPVLVEIPDRPAVEYPVLLDPSPASGLPAHLLPRRSGSSPSAAGKGTVNLDSREFALLRSIWRDESTRTALDEVLDALRFILSEATESPTPPATAASLANGGSSGSGGTTQAGTWGFTQATQTQASQRIRQLEATQKADDFGEVRDGSRAASVLGSAASGTSSSDDGSGSHRAGAATILACVRGFVSVEMACSGLGGPARPVRLPEVVDAILHSASGDESLVIAEAAFSASLAGLVQFGLENALAILHHFGEALLPSYRYARDERFARAALRFLECTKGSWIRAEGAAAEIGADARVLCAWVVQSLRKKIVASWRVRLQLTAFLDMYLEVDPLQELWDVAGNALRSEDGRLITPTAIIPFLLGDRDFRVRFRAATSAANLFNLCASLNVPEDDLFFDIRGNLTHNTSESEQILTQILCNANIMVVAGTRRRAPYQLLVATASRSPLFAAVVIASLEGVRARLGFDSLADLYLHYARYFLWLELRVAGPPGPDIPQRLAYKVCGYPTLREARKADFNQTASLLLQEEDRLPAFRTMCDVLKRSEQEGRLACLAETISLALCSFHQQYAEQVKPPYDRLSQQLYAFAEAAGMGDLHQQDKLVASIIDDVFAETLSLSFDAMTPSSNEPQPSLAHDQRAVETFAALTALPAALYNNTEPNPPLWPSGVAVRACVWLDKQRRVFSDPAVVFSVVHALLGKVHRGHFVPEQRRQLVNLALAVSLCHRGVKEQGILATLADGLIRLLPEFDLVVLVPAMLRWTVTEWLSIVQRDSEVSSGRALLCQYLVRAAHGAARLEEAAAGQPDALHLIAELQKALRDAVRQLLKLGEPTTTEAALLWPTRTFSFSALDSIHDALASSFAPVGKFGIVSALQQHKNYAALVERPDRGEILWRLMQAIGPQEELLPKDCFAFADLLYDVEGEVEPPGVDKLSLSYREASHEGDVEGELGIKRLIVERVLEHLNDETQQHINAAFETAKLVFSVNGTDALFSPNESSLPAAFAAYLSAPELCRPSSLRHRSPRKLSELQAGDFILGARDFSPWVKQVAELLADARAEGDDFYAQLVPLIQLSSTFAKEVVPYLVHSVLLRGAAASEFEPEQHVSAFVQQVLEKRSSSDEAVRLVVDAAIYLRKHGRPDLSTSSRSRFDNWLAVPWVLLADGAVRTGAYLAGLLFLELGHEYNGLFSPSSTDRKADDRGQALLYEIYAHIDEPDGFYGRESHDVRQALLKRYRHEGQWDGAFRTYGAQHEAQASSFGALNSSATGGVITSLASFGFNRLAMAVYQPARLEGALKAEDVPADLPYELAWRSDVWDLPIERQAAGASSVSLYSALRASRTSRTAEETRRVVEATMVDEVKKLSAVTLDLPRPNTEALSTILALRDVHRLAELHEGDKLTPELISSLATVPTRFSFDQAERVLSSRISVLRGIRNKEHADQVADAFTSDLYQRASAAERACLLELSRVARRSGILQAAFNAVTLAHTLVDDGKSLDVDEELANVLWAQGEHTTAITLLKDLQQKSPTKPAAIYAQLGEWHAEARVYNAQQILEEHYEPAIRALDRKASPAERAHVYNSFAQFADAQFGELEKVLEERRQRTQRYEQRKEYEFAEIERQLHSGSGDSTKLTKSRDDAGKYLAEDRRQLQETEKTTQTMLQRSVENYAKALATSDDYDDKVFRLCALWLARPDNDTLHQNLKELLDKIPSHKFVFLAYQLSARLTKSSQTTPSAANITRLVTRLCIEHPFHALYPVNALRDLPPQMSSSRRSSTSRGGGEGSKNSRAQAASDVMEKVKRKDPILKARVEAVEQLLEAYAQWAEFNIKRHQDFLDTRGHIKKTPLPIPASQALVRKVKDLPVPVTTFDLPVDKTGRYEPDSFPHIVQYGPDFGLAGGVNLPKIVICYGSDGKEYKQLLKGNDDIRQDAVMEQLFTLVNSLLARDEGGRRRKLRLRTYKVVPLQRSNGLIEFAANTQPLGSFLQRLYDRMAPGTWRKPRDAFYQIEQQYKHRPEPRDAAKRAKFPELVRDYPPLLRYLFWQKHKVPSLWFDMRLNYSRSVAVSSIVGHLVGLGDRHVSNILMDDARGELVHIDFGVAFDQGKRLPIPELVPFRLTQNIVDGFGMSGVDGVFRRCCEETLRVLRERSSIVMTVLEVFKYDPLQNWAVSADMAKRIQGSEDGDAVALDELPDDADRALNIVKGKLDSRLSVQYTVNQLIQEATDPNNLAVIFSGWQALV